MTALQKVRMLRCASSFVVAAYTKVRLTPQGSRALPAELFTKPPQIQTFLDFLRVRQLWTES
jgi:hypothetical protein